MNRRRLAAPLLLGLLAGATSLSADELPGLPAPIDIEANIRQMLEAAQAEGGGEAALDDEEPPLLSGADAPPLVGREAPSSAEAEAMPEAMTETEALETPPALDAPPAPVAKDKPATKGYLPLPEKTIIIEGVGGVQRLQEEIDAARRRHDEPPADR